MSRIDLVLNPHTDTVKYPRAYVTSDAVLLVRKTSCITIQRYWRGYTARNTAKGIRQRNIQYKADILNEKNEAIAIEEEKRVSDMLRRNHPKSKEDFAVLYNELDTWRREEVNKIKTSVLDPEARKLAMSTLLQHETKALQSLQALKCSAKTELQGQRLEAMLSSMAMPLQWQLSHGEVATVATVETTRAKEWLEIYREINKPVMNVDERLQILLKVKVILPYLPDLY
jgi:predicted CopG family antitoxin